MLVSIPNQPVVRVTGTTRYVGEPAGYFGFYSENEGHVPQFPLRFMLSFGDSGSKHLMSRGDTANLPNLQISEGRRDGLIGPIGSKQGSWRNYGVRGTLEFNLAGIHEN